MSRKHFDLSLRLDQHLNAPRKAVLLPDLCTPTNIGWNELDFLSSDLGAISFSQNSIEFGRRRALFNKAAVLVAAGSAEIQVVVLAVISLSHFLRARSVKCVSSH